ncbi:4'-phosphopantetheinyl transferase family protein [Bacillus smithii]|uniref:4'-phosphopantetheinyl transferase family protein n=1 Tax=Bacillus smithii TaxID=1479 RepID=UPI002E222403|nr:4'-phosphopantetheinyl transferase superfamily protein [Bacillus smithii]
MQVHLIRIDSSRNLNDYQSLYPLLNRETKKKISRFLNESDKIRSLLSHLFLKYLISRELSCDLTDIQLAYEKYGKPYLLSSKELSFNISHSGEFIAIAISNENVGIDIQEYIDLDYEELAMRFFTKQEYNYISSASNVKENFFRIWTLKESYLKARGSGLHSPLNSFYFSFKNNKIHLYHEGNNTMFYFHSEIIHDNYHMSICSTKEIGDFEFHEYNQVELDTLLLGGN